MYVNYRQHKPCYTCIYVSPLGKESDYVEGLGIIASMKNSSRILILADHDLPRKLDDAKLSILQFLFNSSPESKAHKVSL